MEQEEMVEEDELKVEEVVRRVGLGGGGAGGG